MYVGIDVSKKSLEVKSISWKKSKRYANTKGGIKQLVTVIKEEAPELIVLEATGGYEREAALALQEAGLNVSVVNPSQTSSFAKSLGNRAKTDKIDADMLARFAEAVKPRATKILGAKDHALKELVRRRQELVDHKTQEQNRRDHASGIAAASIRKMLKVLKKEIGEITAKLDRLAIQDAEIAKKSELLKSAKGVGKVATMMAIVILVEVEKTFAQYCTWAHLLRYERIRRLSVIISTS